MAGLAPEAAVVQALISNTPEALLRLLTGDGGEPDANAAALLEALGKKDVLTKALAATAAARRGVASDRAETAAGCFDARFRREVGRALERLSEGESCAIKEIEDEDAREAFEHVLRGLGLRPQPREAFEGFAADDACSRRACAALAGALAPSVPVAAPAPAAIPMPTARAPRGPARPPVDAPSSDDDGPAPAAPDGVIRARRPAKRVKKDEDDHAGWTRAADGTKGDCGGQREGWMLTPPSVGELTALTKDGLPAAKSRLGNGRGALPQPTAAEVAADEERRRAARAARGPALVETFKADKGTAAPAPKPAKWTRDAMDGPQKMDAKAARAVIEKAKALDSRFASSYRQ